MREIPISKYIYMGTSLRYLQDCRERALIHSEGGVIENISRLLDRFEEYSMPVSFRAASRLKNLRDELKKEPDASRLSQKQAKEVNELAKALRQTIFAEANGVYAFITSDKRYSTEKLLRSVRELLTPSVFDKLPEIAKLDLDECGKCIAFERATAGAFHVLRATEAVLKHLYCCIVQRGRVSPMMWGNMITHLRKRKPGETDFLDQLDIIRKNFRNPTQHPEKNYNVDEVQNLLALCIHAIDRMAMNAAYKEPE